MSKKYNKKSPKTTSKQENVVAVKKTVTKQRRSLKFSYLHFIPLCCALVVFIILWSNPFEVNVKDPWFVGGLLVDSAAKETSDTNQRNVLLQKAHKILAEQVQIHPYHARIHYMYGYYWFLKKNWDSAIFHQKEAIRIGAGGTVNQVEFSAQDLLNLALGNKVAPPLNAGNLKEASDILENAKTPVMDNPGIDKYQGLIYSRQGNIDGALISFLRYYSFRPNDADNLANIAITYNQKNMRDSALTYIDKALKADPKNANANYLKSQLGH